MSSKKDGFAKRQANKFVANQKAGFDTLFGDMPREQLVNYVNNMKKGGKDLKKYAREYPSNLRKGAEAWKEAGAGEPWKNIGRFMSKSARDYPANLRKGKRALGRAGSELLRQEEREALIGALTEVAFSE